MFLWNHFSPLLFDAGLGTYLGERADFVDEGEGVAVLGDGAGDAALLDVLHGDVSPGEATLCLVRDLLDHVEILLCGAPGLPNWNCKYFYQQFKSLSVSLLTIRQQDQQRA